MKIIMYQLAFILLFSSLLHAHEHGVTATKRILPPETLKCIEMNALNKDSSVEKSSGFVETAYYSVIMVVILMKDWNISIISLLLLIYSVLLLECHITPFRIKRLK